MMDRTLLKKRLSFWFTVHFFADVAVALPLFFMPRLFLEFLGWTAVDPVSSRLVGAALFGIGIVSLISRKAPLAAFKEMLTMKIIWSASAVIGFIISLAEGVHNRSWAIWAFLGIFLAFHMLWLTYRIEVGKALEKE